MTPKFGAEVEISSDDDVRGRELFGDAWPQVKAAFPEPGTYAISMAEVSAATPSAISVPADIMLASSPMTKTIRPTMANERGNGSYTIRVEGDDVELLRDALDRGAVVKLDAPDGHFKVIGCSLPSTEALVPVGFFDVDAVEPEAPGEPAEPTDPGRPRSARRSVISPK